MAYTFGAGTGDDITYTMQLGAPVSGGALFTAGWFYPTTLTSGRTLVSFSSSTTGTALAVAPTTTQLRWTGQFGTTSGVWDATDAALVTNEWQFVALLYAPLSNASGAVRVWKGNTSGIFECAVTQTTAPSGTVNSSQAVIIGNRGTASLAFQGHIGWWATYKVNQITPLHFLSTATNATITQDEADLAFHRLVLPHYNGSFNPGSIHTPQSTIEYTLMDLGVPGAPTALRAVGTVYTQPFLGTVNGATIATEESPVRMQHPYALGRQGVMRR